MGGWESKKSKFASEAGSLYFLYPLFERKANLFRTSNSKEGNYCGCPPCLTTKRAGGPGGWWERETEGVAFPPAPSLVFLRNKDSDHNIIFFHFFYFLRPPSAGFSRAPLLLTIYPPGQKKPFLFSEAMSAGCGRGGGGKVHVVGVVVVVVLVVRSEVAPLRRLRQLGVVLEQHLPPQLLQDRLDGVLPLPAAQDGHAAWVNLR